MSLFKHSMVSGINDALVDRGIVSWPNESVGFEVCSKIAADLSGPDMLPEGGLAKESALLIGERIKEAADTLIAEGYGPDASAVLRTKQAAAMDFTDRAAWVAEACMSKAAEEASLTSVGPNTAESAVQTDQHAALDQHNRATNKYLMGVGRTGFPNGGVVGQQMMHPEKQKGPSISNSLTSLDKQANDMTEYLRSIGVTDIPDEVLNEAIANAPGLKGLKNRLVSGLAHAPQAIGEYGRRAASNPFAGAAGKGFLGGAKHIGGNVARHPAAHAAALAAALYGTSKAIPAIRRGFADDAEDSAQFMQQAADGGNKELAEYLGHKQANDMTEYLRSIGVTDIPDEVLNEAIANAPGPKGLKNRLVSGLAHAPQAIGEYGRRAGSNPFAGVTGQGLMGGAKALGGNLARHPATHAAALAAALYGAKKLHNHYTSPAQVEDRPPEAKQANEDMAASDLGGAAGEGPGRLERAMMFLHGLKNKLPNFRPSPEAQVAAAGLGEAGTPGMEVMAHVLDTVKTASEAEDVLQQILHHQGEAGALATPELVEAIEHMMAHGESPEASKEAAFYEECLKIASDESAPPGLRERAQKLVTENAGKALEYAKNNKLRTAGGALATVGAAYGAKKLYNKMKRKAPAPAEEQKAAALLNYLKAAAEGSLTDVGENTEQSAAHTDSVAELDMKNRAPGAYLAGVGNTRMPNKGQVYAVEPAHQDSPVHTDNLPTNETKSAELAYVSNFRKIASELGPYLPATMDRDEKVAHLQALMGMPPSERSGYLKALRAG